MVEAQRDEIMQMRREQRHKDQEMKEMISCISHDIRTPLTSISGYIEMLSHAEEQDIPRYRVCQEKCVSFFVSFFTSVNLFCYLQIYHHHF
ncbi:MAG TPA: hypothetical protein H9702_02195 [Candidatus Merdibacter merdavium]|uniref:histidine kinase n=1 Tax=Candidatus Merdibacter merdavium TaxID=2838692 RepID=A0A9D2SVS8_9FIRM|nr:hypothetical protein [Candidatus Merdibacter merdavium]